MSISTPSKHWQFLLLLFSGITIVYTLRVNMSVAVTAMQDELGWTEEQKGLSLSSFYWGYSFGQIPISFCLLNGYVSGKTAFGVSVLVPSILTALVPLAARYSFFCCVLMRVLIGMIESASFPCCYYFFPAWIPLVEKTAMISTLFSATYMGEIIGFSLSGLFVEASLVVNNVELLGWPSVFYFFAFFGIIWYPVWLTFAYERPEYHPNITQAELAYIQAGKSNSTSNGNKQENDLDEDPSHVREEEEERLGGTDMHHTIETPLLHHHHQSAEQKLPGLSTGNAATTTILQNPAQHNEHAISLDQIPWRALASHTAFWNLMYAGWCVGFISYTLLSEMPSYLTDYLGYSISTAGVLSTAPFALLWLCTMVFGNLFTKLQIDYGWSVPKVRFAAQGVFAGASSVFLLGCILISPEYRILNYLSLLLATAMIGANFSGYACSFLEIAPRFSVILNTLGNTAGALAGLAGPLTVSSLLTRDHSTGWQYSFLVTISQCVFSLVVWYFYAEHNVIESLNTPLKKQK